MADYQALKDWLYGLQIFGIKLGLNSTEELLKRLGNPERGFPSVHLAGTNAKGSIAAFIAAVLQEAGYRTGFYSSPHLINLRERFLVNGRMPTRERFLESLAAVRRVVDDRQPPTFFEFTTAVAMEYFRRRGVEAAVIETGLGGRLDATNVLRPLVSVISDIGLEHTQYLGRTLAKIAWEKAGIIKPATPVVVQAQHPAVRPVIAARAEELKAPLIRRGREYTSQWTGSGLSYRGLTWRLRGLEVGLIGRHQGRNASSALAALEALSGRGLAVDEAAARRGLARVRWPGRLEIIDQRPEFIVDGGHNPAAVRVLARALSELKPRPTVVVLGSMSDKDHKGVLRAVAPAADELILTRAAYERSASPETLARAAEALGLRFRLAPELMAAVELGRRLAGGEGRLVVTGSLFVVGEVLDGLKRGPLFEEE